MSSPAAADLEARIVEPAPPTTIAIHELIQRAHIDRAVPPPRNLIAWLLESGFAAKASPGRLAPTLRARQLGGTLTEVERDNHRNR